ncbi:protein TerF, partial [Escherichia coli]
EGAVRLVTGSQQASIEIALDRVPANVSKIAITVVIDGEDTISSGCTLTDKMAIEKVQLTYLDLVVARW